MRPACRAVDHLQRIQFAAAIGERLQHNVPYTGKAPAAELPPHRVPVAELFRQIAPWRAGAGDPENAVQHAAMVVRRPPAACRGHRQERREDRPFIVCHQTADHCQPPEPGGRFRITRLRVAGTPHCEKDTSGIPDPPSRFFSESPAVSPDSPVASQLSREVLRDGAVGQLRDCPQGLVDSGNDLRSQFAVAPSDSPNFQTGP